MKIIIETMDALFPAIASDERGYPIIYEDDEEILKEVMEKYQKPIVVKL